MKKLIATIAILGIFALAWNYAPSLLRSDLTDAEVALIASLSLSALEDLPTDPSNKVADNPQAAQLGHALFFDTRLSGSKTVACATCHQPAKSYTDGLPLAVGTAMGPRHTPSLLGISYSPWFYWDGRKDSQWAQALAPLEASHEHNIDRVQIANLVFQDASYREQYAQLFGEIPKLSHSDVSASPVGNEQQQQAWQSIPFAERDAINLAFANIGKALAAYQRKILPGRTRFDDYADSLDNSIAANVNPTLTAEEIAGLKVFIGKGQCATCHNGPLFTNHEFHNTGVMPVAGELPPMARYDGVRTARLDPFNCLGKFSDAKPSQCIELRFARDTKDLVGAQKTPTLRNIADTAPYMHGGQITMLKDVISHYNNAPTSMLSHNEAKPLGLRRVESQQLLAFLKTLSAPLAIDNKWLTAPSHSPISASSPIDPTSQDSHVGPVAPIYHQGQ
jgi:cytochrome c peroxidase